MIVYRCSKCGKIIYAYYYGKDFLGVPTPSEVRAMLGGICPYCKKPLKKPTLEDVKIYPREEVLKNKKLVMELQRISKQQIQVLDQSSKP
ncbi:hypothetical protein DRH29_03885 [candidate division Kazan bacterium]|uniref:Uncharacterized protein n=1 Tax=candidate division Kazan bacterium TaxID=2202143 RepID=A0A420ZBX2_UNCK3|nr:MAG: hypothetical protein DRH29_03885 [candidate division Kazan bacterium]